MSDLGVTIDQFLNFDDHITAICRSTYFHIRNIGNFFKLLCINNSIIMLVLLLFILNGSGITVNDEQEVVKEVERFWGNLFCKNGKVTPGQKKEMIGKGMTSEGQIFSQQDVAIKKLKENEAADDSGVMTEYLTALEVEEVEKLRGLMNEILNGADIPNEWNTGESRDKLLHKGGRTDELKK